MTKQFSLTGLILLNICNVDAQPWQRNTFPGLGHYENGYTEGHGWDHVEASQDLAVSPVDPKLRIFVDNEWSAVISEDGKYYAPLHMPHTGSGSAKMEDVEFSRYDSSTIYMVLAHEYWRNLSSDKSPAGIWRSPDRGETWEHIYKLPEGTYERFGNYPEGTHLTEDPLPLRNDHIYFGSTSHGIIRTTDGGSKWESIAPVLSNRCIKMIKAGSNENNETFIYAIAEKKMPVHIPGDVVPIANWCPTDFSEQWRLDQNYQGTQGNSLGGPVSFWDASCATGSYAAGFNGVSTSLSVENMNYSASQSMLSVTAWVKTTNGGDQVIASFDEDAYWQLGINGPAAGTGQVAWSVYGSNGIKNGLSSISRIDDGDWHHVAGVWNMGSLGLYIDGVLEASMNAGTSSFGSGETRYGFLGVGSKSAGFGDSLVVPDSYFEGSLDDVRIYNGWAMTRNHIMGLYFETSFKNPVAQGSLWRIKINANDSVSEVVRLQPDICDFSSIELNPSDPSRGWVIRKGYPNAWPYGGRELYRFSSYGEILTPSTAQPGGSDGIYTVGINPSDTSHVFLLCGGAFRYGIRYSRDGGSTWQGLDRAEGDHIPSLQSWSPRNHHEYGSGFPADGFTQPRGTETAFVKGAPGEILWMISNRGLLRSTDYGATFTSHGAGGPNKDLGQIAVAPGNPDSWATCSFEYGFIATSNGGRFWTGTTEDNDETLASLTQLAESEGNNWTFARTGSGIAYHPTDASKLIATYTKSGHIVRSEDAGKTWISTGIRNPIDEATGVFWCRTDAQRVYAGRMRSMDGGTSWTDIGQHVIAVSDANPDLLVGVDYTQRNLAASSLLMHVSIDGGANWTELPGPPKEGVPGTSSYWLVIASARTWGRMAMDMVAIDPSPGHDPAVNPDNRLRILMAGRSGIYEYNAISADGGGFASNWQIRDSGLEPNLHYSDIEPVPWMGFVIFDPRPGYEHVVYAAKTMDIQTLDDWSGESNKNHSYPGGDNFEPYYLSQDGGISWEKLHGEDFPEAPLSAMIHSLEVDTAGRLFAATCEGIYHISVKGISSTPPTVTFKTEFMIRDKESGEAIPGCQLEFDGRQLLTDGQGKAYLDSLDYGVYSLFAAADGYQEAVFTGIHIFSDTSLSFNLNRDYNQLSVKVINRSTGDPVYRAKISYDGKMILTNQAGEASIDDLDEGYWVYSVEHNDYFKLTASIMLTGDTSLLVQLTRTIASLRFLVSDAKGPLQDISVIMNGKTSLTDISGMAFFSPQPARVEYPYSIEESGYKPVQDTFFLETDTILRVVLETLSGTGTYSSGYIKVYPNPVSGKLYVDIPASEAELRLVSIDGKILMIKKIYAGNNRLDISTIAEGICFLHVLADQSSSIVKLMIRR